MAVSSFGAPFAQKIPYTQPDGRQIELWGEGDEFYAVFESLDGYTVMFDPTTKAYHYAQLSPDGSTLVSTGALVGKDDPAALGLAKHLRMRLDAVKKQAQQRFQQWDQGMEVSQRWIGLKAAQRPVGMGVNGDIAMAPPSSPTTGTKVGLTLLVDFSDDAATIPQADINNYCNDDNYTGYGNNGSVKQYFWDVSNGTLLYTNVITVYIRAPQPKSYYNVTTNDSGAQANILIRDVIGVMTNLPNYQTEILPQFEGLTVNSSTNVIACNVFYAGGNGGVWSKGLWPHSWSLYNVGAQSLSPGGKKVYRYQITNIGTSLSIGTFCHENGHMLCGFPDIYDYGYDSMGGAGSFCLMGYHGSTNPQQVCAYLKRAAGWATTTELIPSMAQTISVSSSGEDFNHFYRYSKPGVPTEYFLIENRQKTGRDAGIAASGIAIWHVDELGNKDNQSLTPNSSHLNYECTLVQADNLWHFQRYSNSGDSKDLYYSGNTATGYANQFTDTSAPNARWWDNTLSGVRLGNFSASGSTMTFTIGETTPTENNLTTTINGNIVTSAGAFMVATNGSFNALIITNSGMLVVTNGGVVPTNGGTVFTALGDGVIGNSSVSSNNCAIVTGAGSLWSNRSSLYVGSFGSSNSFVVADSARALNTTGYVGYDSAAANNSVQVTGAGSIWSNSSRLYVGYYGSSNSMTIAGGAQVFNGYGNIGNSTGASDNVVVVTDAGSVWGNGNNLMIGNAGIRSILIITNGGHVLDGGGNIGWASNSTGNLVLVAGSDSVWSNSGSAYVGVSGYGNMLLIANSGRVNNTIGYIGYNATASNNTVWVTDAGSLWSNSSSLNVGNSGSSNSLIISNGGTVLDTSGYIGSGASSSNNSVFVTDSGSLWSNSSSLYVGLSGVGNSLTITNGGRVFNSIGCLGGNLVASNNSVLVTGAGSIWSNSSIMYVGGSSPSNSLTILNGGQVIAGGVIIVGNNTSAYANTLFASNAGYIASVGLFINSRSNSVTLADNALWNLRGGSLTIGYGVGAFGNTLSIDASSALTNIYGLTLGENNTTFCMTNSAAGFVFNEFTTNQLRFSNGFGALTVGSGPGAGTTLIVSNYVLSAAGLTIGNNGSRSNNVTLLDNSVWNLAGRPLVMGSGAGAHGNSLSIDGSSALTNIYGLTLGDNNTTFYMTNSADGLVFNDFTTNQLRFSNGFGALTVGGSGSGTMLIISNYLLRSAAFGYVGNGGTNNALLMTGSGSVWSNNSSLYVGLGGSGNNMTITNSGQVIDSGGYIGNSVGHTNNWVLVTGTGSLWGNSNTLNVGNYGSNNHLTIANGGWVTNSMGYIGYNTGATNNWVLVTDAGSLWSNGSTLYVGYNGVSHYVTVANSGRVVSASGYIGYNSSASNNAVVVTGAGSLWTNAISLVVGNSGSGNRLAISNGGQVINGLRYIGYNASASNNTVLVTGSGSVWNYNNDLNGALYVGHYGPNNSLVITNGGQVFGVGGAVGYQTGSVNNTVLVAGAGSIWTNTGTLNFGSAGWFNRMTISAGGAVMTPTGIVGNASTSSNNTVLVTDSGSLWSNLSLTIGGSGMGNSLTITNTGVVSAVSFSSLGAGATASNNSVLVTGVGSVWNAGTNLYVGSSGSSNRITVANGGRVVGITVNIGANASASNNAAVVTGAGSVWTNNGDLYVGYSGRGNSLTIASGGTVLNNCGYVGYGSTASNNSVLVTDSGSLWSNAGALTIGRGGLGNRVTLADGGTIYASVLSNFSGGVFSMLGGNAFLGSVFNAGAWTVTDTGSLEVRNSLTVGAAAGLTNRDGGNVRLVSNATASVSGSFVITNATLEFAGASTGSTPFLSGVTFRNGAGVAWSGYGGDFGDHAITASLNLDLPSGPGLMRGIVDNARLAIGGDGFLYAGSNNLVALALTNGAQVLGNIGYIAFDVAASNSSALVSGPGSVWSNSDSLFVGYHGSLAALTLTDGGTVSATNIVVGFDSASTGNVITVNGGRLYATNADGGGALDVRYGALTLNSGTVTVDRLLLTNGASSIFNFNGGVLNAAEMLSAQPVTVNGGTLALADSFVNLSESTFQLNSGSVLVPNVGVNLGTFIQNGGLFDPAVFTNSGSWLLTDGTNVDVVFLNMASGTVLQSGGEHDVNVATNFGVWTVSGGVANLTNLVIDGGGGFTNSGGALFSTNAAGLGGVDVLNGTLALHSGTVTVNQLLATNFASSVVSFNGGTLNSGGSTVDNSSIFQAGDGTSAATLHLVGGNHSFANGLFINTNASLTGTGAITGVITNAGTIAPGDSAGILTGSGDLTLLGNSLLLMELAGTNDWLYDQINLAGALNFDGTLTLSLLDGFTVSAGNRFDLFDFSSSSGAFSLTNLPGLDPLLYWDLSALYTTGEIEADAMTGAVVAWGSNSGGQTNVPPGLSHVVSVAAGDGHSMALKADGTVTVWGVNDRGQTNVPAGLSGVVNIAAGSHSVALKGDGTVIAWGSFGYGDTNVPAGLSGVVAIAAGSHHNLALRSNGTVIAWGWNDDQQTNVPAGLSGVVAVAGGVWHSMALKSNGTVVAWGGNGLGQADVPPSLSNVVAIAAGPYQSMALKNDGTVVSWGYTDWWGQTTVPAGLSNVVAIAAASHHSVALKNDGTVVAWGENLYGQTNVPGGLSGVGGLAARDLHNVALKPYGPTITPSGFVLPDGLIGTNYNVVLQAAGGVAPYYWQFVNGRLPEGLNLDSDGIISGTPLAIGLSCFRVRVWGTDGFATDKDYAVMITRAPILVSAVSRKTHGGAGGFDLTLNLNLAVNPTVEPRRYGPTQVLFTFNKDMKALDGVLDTSEFTLTNATYVSASILSSNLTLNLTNVVDQAKVTVVLNGISDLAGNALEGTNAVKIRSLYGDINLSGTVNAVDLQQCKNNLLQSLSASNFLCDINLSSTINAVDLQQVKNNLLHSVSGTGLVFSGLSMPPVLPAATLGEALGAPELVWSTDGDNVWTPAIAPDGSSAAWSGSIGDLNVSWVETMVEGPGAVSFEWKVSSEPGADFLTFSVDGVEQPGRISGETDWQTLAFTIPSGTHRLTWTYAKNRANANGLDAGWLRRVVYQRSP